MAERAISPELPTITLLFRASGKKGSRAEDAVECDPPSEAMAGLVDADELESPDVPALPVWWVSIVEGAGAGLLLGVGMITGGVSWLTGFGVPLIMGTTWPLGPALTTGVGAGEITGAGVGTISGFDEAKTPVVAPMP